MQGFRHILNANFLELKNLSKACFGLNFHEQLYLQALCAEAEQDSEEFLQLLKQNKGLHTQLLLSLKYAILVNKIIPGQIQVLEKYIAESTEDLWRAESLMTIGIAKFNQNDMSCLTNFDEALDIYLENNLAKRALQLQIRMVQTYFQMGDFLNYAGALEQVYEYAMEFNRPKIAGLSLLKIARFYRMQKNYEQANFVINKSIQLLKDIDQCQFKKALIEQKLIEQDIENQEFTQEFSNDINLLEHII